MDFFCINLIIKELSGIRTNDLYTRLSFEQKIFWKKVSKIFGFSNKRSNFAVSIHLLTRDVFSYSLFSIFLFAASI
jgi:hypothetical protein